MQGLTIKILSGPEYQRDSDGWEHYAYKVQLRYEGRTMNSPWMQGLGIMDEPTADDVIESLVMDACSYDNAQDFEDWAGEYGYDLDSRTAERIYKQVGRLSGSLKRLLGDKYESVMYGDLEISAREP